MATEGLSKIWYVAAAFSLYLSLNFWSLSQSWGIEFPLSLKMDDKVVSYRAALLGVFFGMISLAVFAAVALAYARRQRGRSMHKRIPAPKLLQLNSDFGFKVYFYAALVVFLLVPLAANIHFFRKFFDGTAYCSEGRTDGGLLDPATIGWTDCWYGGDEPRAPGDSANGMSFAPFIEPLIVVIMGVAALTLLGFLVWALVRGPARPGGKTT